MPNVPSLETKIKRGYGQGTGADYKPFIRTAEVNSQGTCSVIRDWKNGREVHCLSQGEAMAYRILRWDDNNAEVYEQYPLWDKDFSNAETVAIAREKGLRHPYNNSHIMTTDFYVIDVNGGEHAYSVKVDPDHLKKSEEKSIFIEKLFWLRRGATFEVLYKKDLNAILANNIRFIMMFHDEESVIDGDKYSYVKHMLATKQWAWDIGCEILTAPVMDEIYKYYKEEDHE